MEAKTSTKAKARFCAPITFLLNMHNCTQNEFVSCYIFFSLLDVQHLKGMEIGRQVRLSCPWARHKTGLLYLWVVRLVVTGGSLTRRPKRSHRCLLVKVPWQIN